MPFTLIKGSFVPEFGRPDGDSLRFVPDNVDPIFRLRRRGRGPKINAQNGSVQLRYEAIDTMETGTGEFAEAATEANLQLAMSQDGRGHICTNQLGPNGRPIAFVFAGDRADEDGADIWLDPEDIEDSINVKQLQSGLAYPLYYDTLFDDLREKCTDASQEAKCEGAGVWAADRTNKGLFWNPDVDQLDPVFPKLWRRIDKYVRDDTFFEPANKFGNFLPWMRQQRDERVSVPSRGLFTGFDDLIERVSDDEIRLEVEPHEMIIISV
ncbi:hypothetical protein [Erythrobacter sp. YT30]|uniref:hypothetical protein n=1 Tax=Erythrobacter sp. YT30 TaxID=1735012 RepID=UPI000B0F602E|nr:hypothetical protein [Erythrobacter sp. YT30]